MIAQRMTWLSIAAVLLLTACQPQQSAGTSPPTQGNEPKSGGVLVLANRQDPNTTDPLFASGITVRHSVDSIQGTGNLVRNCTDDVYKVCAGLAESWDASTDFTQFTFKLRDNIYWHDGVKFTPEDFKWWLELWYNGIKVGDKTRPAASTKDLWGKLKQVDVLDGNKVRITLSQRAPVFLDQIADPGQVVAHPRHLMQARIEAGEMLLSPADVGNIGLGPYKFLKWEKGSTFQVRKFEKYWEKDAKGNSLPYLDGIDFAILPDLNTIIAAFRTGRLDGGARGTGFSLLPQQIEALKKDMGDKVWFMELPGQRWFLNFNVLRTGPQQDVRVRRAMSLWIDKRAGNQAVMGGQGILHPLMDPHSPWVNPDWQTWPGFSEANREKDKAEAKRLMAETGFANGFKQTFLCRQTWATFCEWMNADLKGLAVELPLDLKDDATWVQLSRSNTDWDVQILRIARRFPEAIETTVTRASITSGAVFKHEDPKIPDFFQRLGQASTQEDRVKIAREMERYILLDQVYAISLFDEVFVFPYRSYVKNMPTPAEDVNQYLDFRGVWLDK